MNVSLTPQLEKFIQKKLDAEMFQTASEVVRHALRVLKSKEEFDNARLESLRQDIQVGLDQLDRGEYSEIKNEADSKALFNRITQTGRARLAAKQKKRRSA